MHAGPSLCSPRARQEQHVPGPPTRPAGPGPADGAGRPGKQPSETSAVTRAPSTARASVAARVGHCGALGEGLQTLRARAGMETSASASPSVCSGSVGHHGDIPHGFPGPLGLSTSQFLLTDCLRWRRKCPGNPSASCKGQRPALTCEAGQVLCEAWPWAVGGPSASARAGSQLQDAWPAPRTHCIKYII